MQQTDVGLKVLEGVARKLPQELTEKLLKRMAERLLSALELDGHELSIVLCGDAEIRGLNARYRGRDVATDVLSFSQREGAGVDATSRLLGDVVISVDTAGRQARDASHTVLEEVVRLLIHGVCHLAGYEHENVMEEKRLEMSDKEQELFDCVEELITGERICTQ